MPIQPLPDSAIRALGSGQVLTDPVALIKELIDNALDANATAISVDASANLIDSIQVRDNGSGIPAEDRDYACRRHCTSKIASFEDINDARSLGFRGEALASAAEMADKMMVTTRVEGEVVAVAMDIKQDGEVKDRKNVSAPIGTTVKITGFLKKLPVRRENAMKNAAKNVAKLKLLIASYYLSHHHCRFSLKVAPGKTAKSKPEAIVYAPSTTVQEAARKVVGKEATTACKLVSTVDGDEAEDVKLGLEMLLPTEPMTNSALVTHYFYVDSRPVACSRGFLKGLLTTIRSRYKASLDSEVSAPSDPFIYVNIRCPPRSYDPNIEPSKDDVMFYDGDSVSKAIDDILTEVYGEADQHVEQSRGRRRTKEPEVAAAAAVVATPQIQIATHSGWEAINSSSPTRAPHTDSPTTSNLPGPSSGRASISPSRTASSPTRVQRSSPVPERPEQQQDRVDQGGNGHDDYDDDEDLYSVPNPRAPPTESNSSPERPQRPQRRATASNWGNTMDYELSDSELPPSPTLGRLASPSEPPSPTLGRQVSPNEEDGATGRRDVNIWNPWTAAKAVCSSKPASSLTNSSSPALPSRPAKRKPESSRSSFVAPRDYQSTLQEPSSSPNRASNQFFPPRAGLFSDSDSDLLPPRKSPAKRTNALFNQPSTPHKTPRERNALPTPARTSPKAKRRRVDDMTGTRTLDSFLQRAPPTQESPWVARLREDDQFLSSSQQPTPPPMPSPAPTQHSPPRPEPSASSEKAALERHYISGPLNNATNHNSMLPPMLSTTQTGPFNLPPPPPYSSQPPSLTMPPPFPSSSGLIPQMQPLPVIAPHLLPPPPHLMPPTMKLVKTVKFPENTGRRKWWFMARREKGYGLDTEPEMAQVKLGLQIKSFERWWERMGGTVDAWTVKKAVEGEWRVVEGSGAVIGGEDEDDGEEGEDEAVGQMVDEVMEE